MCVLPDQLHQMVTSMSSMVALQPAIPPRQAVRPWTKDLSLYEEYKLRRNELRRRNLSRRRELEKTLPQPLLADLVSQCCSAKGSLLPPYKNIFHILKLIYMTHSHNNI